MEYRHHIRTLIIITAIAGISFFDSCKRHDNIIATASVYVLPQPSENDSPVLAALSCDEIKPEQERSISNTYHYKIVIPGNTMLSEEFIPGIERTVSTDGASLKVPAVSLSRRMRLSVAGLLSGDLPPVPGEIVNVTGKFFPGYRFLPHGMLFDSAVFISMSFDTSLIPAGYTVDDIYTFYFDENDSRWKALHREYIDYRNGLVVSATLHFTDMINGIIRIPESPESNGFVPTTIKDMKAADPAAGITLIEAPVANNEGDAELSYLLKIPPGRAGMQPKLKLLYSSDAGNGWAGYGWELEIPGISVDISWGVPRYLNDKESETYLFAGSQLTPVAHRGEYVDRIPEKQFHSRTEGSFSKIIRHGDNPGNYWWEVTGKDGVSSYYGGLPGTGIVTNAVSFDNAGNIGYWALTRTTDPHGNFVSYNYAKPEGCGQQTYISEIIYTGHDGEEGPYKISFLRNDETNTFVRNDDRINGLYGFLMRDKELLRRINMTFNNNPVRSYTFQYTEGVFMKTLLESITELDALGNEFYKHQFKYYDDIHENNATIPYFAEKAWSLPDDNLKSPYLNIFLNNISVLGGSGSFGYSGSLATTVGLFDGKPYSKSVTAGGNVTYMGSENEGFLTLIDINGDGLPDKVFKKDGAVYYRPNLLSYPSEQMFGDKKLVAGINNISISKFSGFGWGVEAHPFIGFLGYTNVSSKTKTSVYFDDFNADGLVDLVNNGVVYFNHVNQDGDPVFTLSSALTPNPLHANSEIDLSILPDPAEEQAQLEEQFPLHDAVRMFQAPYNGTIQISAPVHLVEDTTITARNDTLKDGVKVSIQRKGSILWSTEIEGDDYSDKIPSLSPVAVSKGDRLYFRVQSRFNGAYDKVYWDPEIIYDTINGSDTLVTIKDSNRKTYGRYKASEDFVLSGQQSVGMPKKGAVKIRTAFSKPPLSDTIRLSIVLTDTLGNKTSIFNRSYEYSQDVVSDSINLDQDVLKDEYIEFRVLASTNVDWSKIRWDTYVEYTMIDDGTPVTGGDGKPLLSFKAVPEFSIMFNNFVRTELPVIADSSFMLSSGLDTVDNLLHKVKITPLLLFNNSGNDTIVLSVKSDNKISGKKKYHFNGDTLTNKDTLYTDVQLGDTLYFEYHITNYGLAQSNTLADVIIGHDTLNPIRASVLSPVRQADQIFGRLYRGWGQFDYNGNSDRASLPIDESLLKLSDAHNENVGAMQDTSELNGVQNPQGDVFNLMIPYAVRKVYLGTDEQVYVLPEYVSSSRLGQKNVYVEPIVLSGSGLNALTKVSENKSNSVAAGASPGFISGSASYSWEKGHLTIDMMDMNGDRYPDLLSSDNIQYTGVKGVLSGAPVNHALGDHYSEAEAYGFTLGGSFVHAKSDNSGSASSARSSKAKKGNNAKTNKNASSAQETSKSSIGISGNFSTNNDHTEQTWLDINGDGLPDKIYNDGTVRLNLGYSFAPAEKWNFDVICKGESQDYGGGVGVDIDNGSIVAGVGISKTDNEADETFMDINADGLPDMVKGNNVYFNTGSGFATPILWNGLGTLDEGESVGQSANAGFTIGITIPIVFIVLKICINPLASVSSGVSHTLTQLSDIDGDGMPDFLLSDKENELRVRSSRIFRTNLLKTVENPLGSNYELDYLLTPAIYTHPGGKTALKSVTTYDGLPGDGVDTTYVSFDYEDGFYDRHERKFYGFSSVKTMFHTGSRDIPYRTVVQNYSNRDYYTMGCLTEETLLDSEGNKQLGLQNIYSLYNIFTGERFGETMAQSDSMPAFVALDETSEYSYSDSQVPLITSRVTYSYDLFGNISDYSDYSSGSEKDRYSVKIDYHQNEAKHIYSVPALQEVSTFEGLRRKNETDIDEFGDIIRIRKYISGNHSASYDMEYDEYGNIIKITRPPNYKGERMWYEYDYDTEVQSFIVGVKDAYGYGSSSVYDYKWGTPVEVTDRNNQQIRYAFDDCGRMVSITGPYELASGKPYTIAFEYHPEADVPYANTMHYDSIYDSDIETYSFSDGLGRLVQVKKAALLFQNPSAEDSPGFIVSGKVLYDALGRATEVYQPVFETGGNQSVYNTTHDIVQPASAQYDVLDRIKEITLPDGSLTSHNYNIGYYNGEIMYMDSLADALGNISVTYTRTNGRRAAVIMKSNDGDITTEFEYNGIGELLAVTDPLGNQTLSEYDMTGNRISVDQPDAGLTEFIFDDAGNTISKITANLRSQIPDGGSINYKYDYERLVEIVYPRNIQNRINYTYGEPGAPYNRAGRIVLAQDASGGEEFFYDKLGQVIKTIRTVQLGESDMRTWIWSATYDTWNRVQTMTYPDGEEVTYTYNRAGNLQKLDGTKLGRSYSYISRIGLNKYEKKVYLQYGNGSVTTFSYEPERQRLEKINVSSKSQQLIDNTYTYDAMSNILDITSNTEAFGKVGGPASHKYSYDDLYRLKQASGIFRGTGDTVSYSLGIQYDIMGKILQKTQAIVENGQQEDSRTYDFIYKYEGLKPGVPTVIGGRVFTYDKCGNQTSWHDTVTNDFRQLSWDEENRLVMISDNGYLNRYTYDGTGNRVIKSHGGSQGVYLNGAPIGIINHSSDNYTVYLSPYFVFQDGSFTKYYYNGETRVVGKIGNGQFENQYRPGVFEITAGGVNYINRQQQLDAAKEEYEQQSGIPPGPPTLKGIYADPEYSGISYPDAGTPEDTAPAGWPANPVFAPAGGPPGAPVQWGDEVTNDNVEAGFGYVGTGHVEEELRYFYHTDHLGSAAYITNAEGDVTQFISYLPFGGIFAEQHSDWDSPLKFNAMEMDNETGLYNSGGRYYDPVVSIWLEADPSSENYPYLSPYVFAGNNPVTDKLNGFDEKSFFGTSAQRSAGKPLHLYIVPFSGKGAPNSVSNLSAIFAGPDFQKMDSPKTENTVETDPVKKKIKDIREKLTDIKEEKKKEEKKDVELAPDTETVEDVNIQNTKAVLAEIKAEEIKTDEKIKIDVPDHVEEIKAPEPGPPTATVPPPVPSAVPERKTTVATSEKKEVEK